jgi:hypothetical protein
LVAAVEQPAESNSMDIHAMNKTKLALAVLLLLSIAPVAQAATKGSHFSNRARSAYDYAQRVYGWNGGLYPFNYTPGSGVHLLRSGDKCWVNLGGSNLGWGPCP